MSSVPVSILNFLGAKQSQGNNEPKASREEFLALLGSENKNVDFLADEETSAQFRNSGRERTAFSNDYYAVNTTERLQDLSAVGSEKLPRNEPVEKRLMYR